MPEPTTSADQLSQWQRICVAVIGLVLVAHSVLVVLWLAPAGPVREVVGEDRLATYVDPYFRQGADMMGIGSNRVDESLEVRAALRPEGGGEVSITAWIDITERESDLTRGDIDPARSHQSARRLASNLNFALFALTQEQRDLVAATTADVPGARLQDELQAGPTSSREVQNFIAQDQMATQFASLWLGAENPDSELLQVQYRIGRRVVPDFSDRGGVPVADLPFDYFNVGWRAYVRADPEARSAFTDQARGDRRG